MASNTLAWWDVLCGIAAVNLLAWAASAWVLRRRRAAQAGDDGHPSRLLLLLSAGYVLGCAYRSAFPVFDVQRLVLVDSWLSSVIVGRTVATVAELCFAAQWAVLLDRAAFAVDSVPGRVVARLVLPLIASAEVCSWTAVLTTANLGHVFEESLWGLSAALVVVALVHVGMRCTREARLVIAACCVGGSVYVAYMFGVDVPMYWARWVADEAHGRPYLSLAQGFVDTSTRWVVSHRWDDWKTEVVWMSLYFSVAVWLSIGLVHAPLPRRVAPTQRLRARGSPSVA